jgi:ABC-2 type transport system ATP-binding protein
MNDSAVKIENLVKFYDGRCVLDGIDLKIPTGCIYGLLGRNGAGKTTIIRLLLGLDFPTRGKTGLLGKSTARLTMHDRSNIGYVAEGHHLIQNYRVARLITLCRNLSKKWNQKFFDHLMSTFRLPQDRKVKELSNGMRAQLNLALALAIEPELLILDDPTLGLDTIVRRQFLELAIDLIQREGRTILFSSHILSDVERIADRIGILVNGKLVVDCSLEELKTRVRKLQLIFPETAPDQLPMTDIIKQQTTGREMVLTLANFNDHKQALINTYKPESCHEIPMSLEDIFIECTNPHPASLTIENQGEPLKCSPS